MKDLSMLFLILMASVIIITNNTSVNTFVLSQPGGGECDPAWQRGQCLFDANGNYYFDVDNCSEEPGSSGSPVISECQDTEKELQQEEKEHNTLTVIDSD